MFASAIRINTRLKSHIGTVVAGDNRLRRILEEKRFPWRRIVIEFLTQLFLDVKLLEAIGRIYGSAAGMKLARMKGARRLRSFLNVVPQRLGRRRSTHRICSHEHHQKSSTVQVVQ